MKNPEKEATPAPSGTEPSPRTRPVEDGPSDRASGAFPALEGGDQDPKKISASLRRIRASGPLIIAAIKQNDPQSMERINEIIEQSIQGMNEDKGAVKTPDKPPVESDVKAGVEPSLEPSSGSSSGSVGAAPPAPAPTQQIKARETNQPIHRPMNRLANEESKPQASRPLSADRGAGGQSGQALIRATAQGGARASAKATAQTTPQKAAVAAAQSIVRRVTSWLSVSNANRSMSQAPLGGGHSGPSTVLMQASGFKPRSNISPRVILGIIALAVLLAVPIYFMFRDRLLTPVQSADGELNLISPEDQSVKLVKDGSAERAQGKYAAAIEHFHHALELTPNNMATRFLLAQTYVMAGQNDDAARSCKEILRIQPEHLDARLQLAEIYRAKGNWSAAYREYRNIIELNQSSPQASDALAAIESQQAVAQMEERAAEKARRRRPRSTIPSLPLAAVSNPVPLLPSGLSEVRRVNPPAALSGMGVEEKPDPRGMAEVHKRLGVRYLNIREFRAAINEFLQALNLTPDDKDLYYFIGSSYHGLGFQAEAYDYYTRVDAGNYVGPAASGAKQTRKAAQEANKHRDDRKAPSIKNELEDINENKPSKPKSVMNRILDSLR
ncbi:MAG: tetratricopeptide repeat protein [Blastocatellia bacterium]|nr:tetratricopeptide repeat protein [Blastocatellia bacterium]